MQQMMHICRQQQNASKCQQKQKRRRLLQPRQTHVPPPLAILPRSCQRQTAAPQPHLALRHQQRPRLTALQRQQAKVLGRPLSRPVLSILTPVRRFPRQQQQLQQRLSASLHQGYCRLLGLRKEHRWRHLWQQAVKQQETEQSQLLQLKSAKMVSNQSLILRMATGQALDCLLE
jgi:hypothetical protein